LSINDEFLVLGCGHSESITHFNNNAAILSKKGNTLIDCGHTIKHALHAQNMHIGDIDSIFITHVHGDHVFGLERVAYESLFKYKKRIALHFHESIYDELWNQTLKGSLGRNSEGECTLEDYFDVKPFSSDSIEIHGNTFDCFNVKHTPGKPSFGLLVNEDILFSADTTAIPELIENMKFRVGFHDVTFANFNPVHATLDSLIEMYPYETRKKLYLMSYDDSWPEYEEIVSKNFLGLSKQGMRVQLK